MGRHVLPNALTPILVLATLAMGVAILIEAGLSYLGLGIQPPTPTWGTMLQHAQSVSGAGAVVRHRSGRVHFPAGARPEHPRRQPARYAGSASARTLKEELH